MKKGFTLVELLAVIVILAVILAIAVPGISNMIDNSKRSSFESSAKLVLKGLELKMLEDDAFNPLDINETNINNLLNIDSSNYEKIIVKEMNKELYVTIMGKNKWEGLTVSGSKESTRAYETKINYVRGVNAPVLASGMKPIKWNGSTWVETTENDSEWYDYTNKKWANARTGDGSYWVWIPRYIYTITSGWHSSSTGTIEVKFIKGIDDTLGGTVTLVNTGSATDSNGTWTSHPAFTFGDVELTGIWVGKFESSNDGSGNVKIVPNVSSWRSITVNDIFNKVRSMETNSIYGWGTSGNGIDTHMMKNTEWGVVTYLSKSQYGNPSEIWNNSNKEYKTGCAGSSVDAFEEDICNEYHTVNGVKASTTGNIYGVYDMSGGAWEYVSAYVDNAHSNLITYGNSVFASNSKYKDVYSVGETDSESENYKLTISSKGDALYETSSAGTGSTSWYSDYSNMASVEYPWFRRGGSYYYGSIAGPFYFGRDSGGAGINHGFRSALVVAEGL